MAALRNSITALQQRENNLNAWIRDLESVLFARSLSTEVDSLRRIWAPSSAPARPDALATLANAAAASQPPPASPHSAYPTPASEAWDSRKRKRQGDHPPRRSLPTMTSDPGPQLPPLDFQLGSFRTISAPQQSTGTSYALVNQATPDDKEHEQPRAEASPRSIRISDLLSPVPTEASGQQNHSDEHSPKYAHHILQTPPSPMVPLHEHAPKQAVYHLPPYFSQRRSTST